MPRKQLINGEWMKVCNATTCHMAGNTQPIERFHKNKGNPDGLTYKCKECEKAFFKEYYQQNREKVREQQNEYKSRPEVKKRAAQLKGECYNSDPAFRLKHNVSKYIRKALKARGKTKGGSTFHHLPYTSQELKEHIEKQFDEHMTWENHGTYWHVDHIKPHASFNYDNLTHPDFQKCWALENLRPLEATENIRKSSLYEGKRHYHNKD